MAKGFYRRETSLLSAGRSRHRLGQGGRALLGFVRSDTSLCLRTGSV